MISLSGSLFAVPGLITAQRKRWSMVSLSGSPLAVSCLVNMHAQFIGCAGRWKLVPSQLGNPLTLLEGLAALIFTVYEIRWWMKDTVLVPSECLLFFHCSKEALVDERQHDFPVLGTSYHF
jgi:hypothetical protein